MKKNNIKGCIALLFTASVIFWCSTKEYVSPGVAGLISVLMLIGLWATALFFSEDHHKFKK